MWLGLVLGNVSDLCNLFMQVGTPILNTIICVKAVLQTYGPNGPLWTCISGSDVSAVNICAYGHPIGFMANEPEMGINHVYIERFRRSLPHRYLSQDVSSWVSWWVYQPIAYGTRLDVVQVRISQYWIEYLVKYSSTDRQSEWQHSELLCYVVKEGLIPYACWLDLVVR